MVLTVEASILLSEYGRAGNSLKVHQQRVGLHESGCLYSREYDVNCNKGALCVMHTKCPRGPKRMSVAHTKRLLGTRLRALHTIHDNPVREGRTPSSF